MRNFAKPSVFIYDYEFSKANSFLAQMTIIYIHIFVFISSVNRNIFLSSIIKGLIITY